MNNFLEIFNWIIENPWKTGGLVVIAIGVVSGVYHSITSKTDYKSLPKSKFWWEQYNLW